MLAVQTQANVKIKENDIVESAQAENDELREKLEKKEFTLQLLEQWLFDCELFLRKWGWDDPNIREHLWALKINPDLHKKKITNIVEENKILKTRLKEVLDELDQMYMKWPREVEDRSTLSKSKEHPDYTDDAKNPGEE